MNGADVARKLTILSRLLPGPIGRSLPDGFKSVSIVSLVPAALESITDGELFVESLPKFDEGFEVLRKEAMAEGKVVRYVGVIDVKTGEVKASLEK